MAHSQDLDLTGDQTHIEVRSHHVLGARSRHLPRTPRDLEDLRFVPGHDDASGRYARALRTIWRRRWARTEAITVRTPPESLRPVRCVSSPGPREDSHWTLSDLLSAGSRSST